MRRSTYRLTQPGLAIALSIVVLLAVGVASIYYTDTHYVAGDDGPANAVKQCLRAALSALAALVILRIGYQAVARIAYPIFFLALGLLVPLLLAHALHTSMGGFTAPRNGAYRWLHFPGFPLQPSEFMKVAYILALAWYLRYRENYRRLSGLFAPVFFSAIPLTLILLEPDLGTALLLVPVLFVMLFVAGARAWHLALIVLIGAAAAPFAWGQIRGYQRARVTAVLLQSDALRRSVIAHPERYPFFAEDAKKVKRQAIEWAAGSGYQLVHSKNAIGSGGALGQGMGRGVYVESSLLPDRHNDFVFAIVGHQWGFVGCVVVLACYAVIVLAGTRIASATTDPFGRLLAVGVVAQMAVQVIINIGMTIGLMPITGMTLPFVSYGGSSLLFNFAAVALLVSVSRDRPYLLATRPFEFGREERPRAHLVEYAGSGAGAQDAEHSIREG